MAAGGACSADRVGDHLLSRQPVISRSLSDPRSGIGRSLDHEASLPKEGPLASRFRVQQGFTCGIAQGRLANNEFEVVTTWQSLPTCACRLRVLPGSLPRLFRLRFVHKACGWAGLCYEPSRTDPSHVRRLLKLNSSKRLGQPGVARLMMSNRPAEQLALSHS